MILLLALGCGGGRTGSGPDDGSNSGTPDSPTGCGEDTAVFTEYVWEPVLSQQCVGCHVEGGMAGGTSFVLDPDDMLSSLRSASAVSDRLLLKRVSRG